MPQIPIILKPEVAEVTQALTGVQNQLNAIKASLAQIGQSLQGVQGLGGLQNISGQAIKALTDPAKQVEAVTQAEEAIQRVRKGALTRQEQIENIYDSMLKKRAAAEQKVANEVAKALKIEQDAAVEAYRKIEESAKKAELARIKAIEAEQKALYSLLSQKTNTRLSAAPDVANVLQGQLGPGFAGSIADLNKIGDLSQTVKGVQALGNEAKLLLERLPLIQRAFNLPPEATAGYERTLQSFMQLRDLGNTNVGILTRLKEGVTGYVREVEKYAAFQTRWFVSAAILFAIPAAIYGTVTVLSQFDQTMKTVQGITGVGAEKMKLFAAAAREVGRETPISAVEAGKMGLKLVQAGLSAEEAARSMLTVAKVATLSGEDISQVALTMTTAMAAWKISASEADRIGNVLAATLNFSRLQIADMGVAFNYLASTSAIFNRSLEETNANIAVLSNVGFKASTIGTGLANLFTALNAPSKKFREELARINVSIDQVNPSTHSLSEIVRTLSEHGFTATRSMELLGERAGRQLAGALNVGADAFVEMERRIRETESLNKGFQTSLSGLENQFKLTKNTISDIALALGVVLVPTIKLLTQSIAWMGTNLASGIQLLTFLGVESIPVLTAAVYGLGAALGFVGVTISGFFGWAGLILAAVASIGLINRYLFGNTGAEKIIEDAQKVRAGAENALNGIKTSAQGVAGGLTEIFVQLRDQLSEKLGKLPVDIPRQLFLPMADEILKQRADLARRIGALRNEQDELSHNVRFLLLPGNLKEDVERELDRTKESLVKKYQALGRDINDSLKATLTPEGLTDIYQKIVLDTFKAPEDESVRFAALTDKFKELQALFAGGTAASQERVEEITKEIVRAGEKIITSLQRFKEEYKRAIDQLEDTTPVGKIRSKFDEIRSVLQRAANDPVLREGLGISSAQVQRLLDSAGATEEEKLREFGSKLVEQTRNFRNQIERETRGAKIDLIPDDVVRNEQAKLNELQNQLESFVEKYVDSLKSLTPTSRELTKVQFLEMNEGTRIFIEELKKAYQQTTDTTAFPDDFFKKFPGMSPDVEARLRAFFQMVQRGQADILSQTALTNLEWQKGILDIERETAQLQGDEEKALAIRRQILSVDRQIALLRTPRARREEIAPLLGAKETAGTGLVDADYGIQVEQRKKALLEIEKQSAQIQGFRNSEKQITLEILDAEQQIAALQAQKAGASQEQIEALRQLYDLKKFDEQSGGLYGRLIASNNSLKDSFAGISLAVNALQGHFKGLSEEQRNTLLDLSLQNLALQAQAQLYQGLVSGTQAWILGQQKLGPAIKQATAQALAGVAARALVEGLFMTGIGIAALTPWGAALYGPAPFWFGGAAQMAAIGGVAGVAARQLANSSGGNSGGAGGGVSAGSLAQPATGEVGGRTTIEVNIYTDKITKDDLEGLGRDLAEILGRQLDNSSGVAGPVVIKTERR